MHRHGEQMSMSYMFQYVAKALRGMSDLGMLASWEASHTARCKSYKQVLSLHPNLHLSTRTIYNCLLLAFAFKHWNIGLCHLQPSCTIAMHGLEHQLHDYCWLSVRVSINSKG